jgi:hypothetical protein
MRSSRPVSLPMLILLAIAADARADMVTNAPAATTDRFSTGTPDLNPGFWPTLSSYNLSGVGNTSPDGRGQWATAISPTFALTSEHYAAAGTVYFTTSDGSQYAATIRAAEAVGGTDLQLVQFAAPLPPSIARYAFAPDDQTVLLGAPILSVGVPYRAGENVIASFGTTQESTLAITYRFNYSAAGPSLQDWVQPGDSGGPTFTEEPAGGLALVGLHSFFSGFESGQTWSEDTYVSSLMDTMKNDIAGLGSSDVLTVYSQATPEPSSLALMGIGLACVFAIGRRARRANPA